MAETTDPKQLENPTRSDFPKNTFEEALKVSQAIEDNNGGNSLPPQEVAIALKRGPGSSDFRVLLSSSIKYGLTIGSFNSSRVSLTDLGRDIVEPKDDISRNEAVKAAILKPSSFTKVFEYYKGKKVPEKSFFENTLVRDFEIPKKQAGVFVEIFMANIKYLGLIKEATTGSWFASEVSSTTLRKESEIKEDEEENNEEDKDITGNDSPIVPENISEREKNVPLKVFISHGKNSKILDQIKTSLELGGFEPIVAEEEETTAIPVPKKILAQMRQCQAAVISVSVDKSPKDESKTSFEINQNVLIEIGTAFVLYDERVILVWDKRIEVPSNLQGLYRCMYEGEELSWEAGMRLQKALVSIKKGEKPLEEK